MSTRTLAPDFAIPYEALEIFGDRHRLVKMWLYGAVLRAEAAPPPEIDVLVEFDPRHIPNGAVTRQWAEELSVIFGYPVHLTTFSSARERSKPLIFAARRLLYPRDHDNSF